MKKPAAPNKKSITRHEYPLLAKRGEIYYIHYARRQRVSLGTSNEEKAIKLFNLAKSDWLRKQSENIMILEGQADGYTVDEYAGIYLKLASEWKEPATIHIDEYVLDRLVDFKYELPGTKITVKVGTLKVDLLRPMIISAFHSELLRGCGKSSLNVYIRHLKSIFAYGVDHEYITKNPYEKVKQLKVQREPVRVLTDREISKIINLEPDEETHFDPDPEFLLMIEAYLHTGCRCHELVNLTREDVESDHIIIRHHTKTGNFRVIELNQQGADIFRRVLIGTERPFPRWKPQSASKKFLKYARQAGIRDINLHDLRHTFASRCLESGMSLASLQILMGHESINTTIKFYGHLSREHIKQEIKKLKYGYSSPARILEAATGENNK